MTTHANRLSLSWSKADLRIILMMTFTLPIFSFETMVLHVAWPSIQHNIGLTGPWQQWAFIIYFIAMTCTILVGGRLANLVGNRRIYFTGLLLTACGALLCSLTSALFFLTGRILLGVGSGLLWPSLMSIFINYFSLENRGRAMGFATALGGVFAAFAPYISGLLSQYVSWRVIFLLIIILAIPAAGIMFLIRPRNATMRAPSPSLSITVLAPFALFTGITALAFLKAFGWRWEVYLLLTIAGIATAWYCFLCYRLKCCMLDLSLFRLRSFSYGIVLVICAQIIQTGPFFYWSLFLQDQYLFSPACVGKLFLFASIPAIFIALFVGMWIDRRGPQMPIVLGFTVMILSFGCVSLFTYRGALPFFVVGLFLYGCSVGLLFTSISTLLLQELRPDQYGIGYAIYNTLRFSMIVMALSFCHHLTHVVQPHIFVKSLVAHHPDINILEMPSIVDVLSDELHVMLPYPEVVVQRFKYLYFLTYCHTLNLMNVLLCVMALVGLIAVLTYFRASRSGQVFPKRAVRRPKGQNLDQYVAPSL